MKPVLIDTDVVSLFLRGNPNIKKYRRAVAVAGAEVPLQRQDHLRHLVAVLVGFGHGLAVGPGPRDTTSLSLCIECRKDALSLFLILRIYRSKN